MYKISMVSPAQVTDERNMEIVGHQVYTNCTLRNT